MLHWLQYLRGWVMLAREAATLLAAVGAIAYFGYKIAAGWLLLNLTLEVAAERRSASDRDDHLVVAVTMRKGKVDAARLRSAHIQLTALGRPEMPPLCRRLSGTNRIIFSAASAPEWNMTDEANPYLTLATEEAISLAEYFRIEVGTVYRVEVVVRGDRFRDRVLPSLSQWRASTIVLPTAASASRLSL